MMMELLEHLTSLKNRRAELIRNMDKIDEMIIAVENQILTLELQTLKEKAKTMKMRMNKA